MKNLNLFKSNVSGMDREWIENESGLTRHHGKLWKHVAMIFAVLVMSMANIGLAWGAYDVPAGSVTFSTKVNNAGRFCVEASGVYHYRVADGYSWNSGDGIKTQSNLSGVVFYLNAFTEIAVNIKHTESKNAHDVTVHVYSIPESEYKQFDDNKSGAAEKDRTFSTTPSTSSDDNFTISVTAETKTFTGKKTLSAGYYAVVPVGAQSKTYFSGISFTPGTPTFSVSAGAELTAETDAVTLTSSGNTVYYKWSTNSSAYAANAGATLAAAADGSGTSPVDATAPDGTGTYYLYAVAKKGTLYSDVVKRNYTIVAGACSAPTSPSVTSDSWVYVPGEEIELTASATGTNASTTYTWYRGATIDAAKEAGAIQAAATAAAGGNTYSIASCTASDAYRYWCVISNGTGCEASASYDIKIYTFFLYNNDHSANSSHTFTTIDRSNASNIKISVGVDMENFDYTYYFKVSDGLGTWYGKNSTTITSGTNYADGLNSSGANVGLTTNFGDVYNIDYYVNSNNIVVTYPNHSQAASKKVYFDNSLTNMSNMYIRIGHTSNSSASSAFTKVTGTQSLYEGTTIAWDNFRVWSIADNTGWTGSNSIYQPWDGQWTGTGNDYQMSKQTDYQRYRVTETITIVPTATHNSEHNCQYYYVDKVSGMKKDNVSITAPTNGTITVAYTSGSGGSITSGNVDLAHTSILTVSAVGNTGYDLSTLTINESAHTSGETYVLSEDAVVAATFTGHTYTVSLDKEGGSGTASVSAQYQASLSTSALFDAPTFSGYTYAGFYTDHAGAGSQLIDENRKWVKSVDTYTDGTPKWIKTSNVTLYAKWTQSVTVDDNDENHGSTTGSISMVYKGTGPSSFTAATGVAGYTLRGYYSAATGGTKILNADGSFAGTNVSVNTTPYISGGKWVHEGATTLYPQYDILTYTVSTTVGTSGAATGGASITNGSVSSVPYGTTITDNDNTFTINTASPKTVTASASVSGVAGPDDDPCTYVFSGWDDLPSTVTADASVTALYEARFTIGFKETDGTAVAGISSTYYVYGTGKAVSTFPAPTKSGYTFAGWYKDDALNSPATDLDNEAYGAIDYYAKWNISYDFQMIANSSAASDATLDLDEYIAQGSKNCVTLTGGTAQYQGASGKTMKVNASNGSGTSQYYGWYFNSSGDKIVVTLSSHVLQVGSVISVEGYGADGNGITANTSTSLVNGTGAQQQWSASHTVVAGDTHLVGKNVITFDRYNSCRIFSIRISNCASATPCTTPTLPSLSNQAGCSYSAWNATPSNASTISSAGESISYSWKKGATEKATTASYTPDADGTDYTVKVTVSKAGKITTSVTSSALSATKYGNPSVTGPSDAEYVVDESASNLSVTATPDHGESLTYQWYSNTSKSTSSPTPTVLENCTTSTYKPSTAAAGTTYYFCKVSGGCADVYSSIATVTVTSAITYTIKYNKGTYGTGDDIDDGEKTDGVNFTLSSSTYSRTGYVQMGWSTDEGGRTKDYNLGGTYSTDDDIDLYPYWEIKNTYTFDKVNQKSISTLEGEGWTFNSKSTTSMSDNGIFVNLVKTFADNGVNTPKNSSMDNYSIAFAKNTSAYAIFDIGFTTAVSAVTGSIRVGSTDKDKVFTINYLGSDGSTVKHTISTTHNKTNWGANAINETTLVRDVRYIKIIGIDKWLVMDQLNITYVQEAKYFTGDTDGAWSKTTNWYGGELPDKDDPVVVQNAATVDITTAQAKRLDIESTGSLTINAGKALIIAETLTKNGGPTSAADVIINSTRAAGVGALVIGGETGANQATVNFATKAKNDGGWVNQFIGSPFSDNEPYVDYAIQLYKFVPRANGDRGWWSTVHEGDEMEEFWGYNVLYNDASELDVTWTGTLNASESKTISGLYYNGSSETDNMFANSWTAPIHVGAFEDGDFVNASTTLYMFNAGTPAQEAEHSDDDVTNGSTEPGTYISIPIHSAPYAGIGVIPSMQAFYVLATGSSASLTLDYNKIVYTPALTSVGITPNRAPKRDVEVDEPEVIKLRVQSEAGWAANTYVLGRADFAEGYEDGWDGAYIEGESATPKLYTPSVDGNMFVNCLPQIDGTVIGFRKGSADSQYTFTFGYEGNEEYYLKDLKLDTETRIDGEHSYTFTAEAEDNAARFIIIRKTPTIATGVEDVENDTVVVRKLIIDDKVYIIRGGMMYDVTGKMIK